MRTGFRSWRGTLGTALAVLALTLSGCKKDIVHGLTELEATEVMVALMDRGIASSKELDKYDAKKGQLYYIAVDEEFSGDAQRVLLDERLPRPHKVDLETIFGPASMIPTDMEQKARLVLATQGELEKTIQQVPGVVDASVHLVMPETNPLEMNRDLTKAGAAVLVKYTGKLGETRAEDQLKKDNEAYRALLIALGEDLTRLRKVILRDLNDFSKNEKGPLVQLDTYFTEKRGDDADAKEARANFNRLKEQSLKRDGTLRQLEALPKIKDLDATLAKVQDLEIDALPFKSASLRSLVARSTPRLSEDDVAVEFVKVQPKSLKDATQVKNLPVWQRQEVFLGLAGVSALLATGLVALGLYLQSLKKQLASARAAAAKASASLGASMSSSAPSASQG